jgi:hypothetical protein
VATSSSITVRVAQLLSFGSLCLLMTGCSFAPVRRADPPEIRSVDSTRPTEGDPFPNWTFPPHHVEDLVFNHEMQAESLEAIGKGLTGAGRAVIAFPERDVVLEFKWKEMVRATLVDWIPGVPGVLDGVNNSPRKEIAAWKVQSLFLDPVDFVVPPSVAYCVEAEKMRTVEPPTLEDTQCVLGVLSLWLKDVTLPSPLLDVERFSKDPLYATFLADFNLLTYLIEHHDGRTGNFLVAADDTRRRVFAIDNGNCFGGPWYNWFVANWSEIRVPALRRASIERLRRVQEEDVEALLGVVAQLERDDRDILQPVDPGKSLDDDAGVRWVDGVLQLGLTGDEIEDVWERIEALLEDIDEGDIAVF